MYKILKIVIAVIGLLGVVFLGRIMAAGDTVLQDDYVAEAGNSALVDSMFNPFATIIYIVLILILAFVVFFVIKGLLTGGGNIKNTLIGVGAFLVILAIGYGVSGGDPLVGVGEGVNKIYAYDDVYATESESRLVGGGLVAFYILSVMAIGTLVFSGIKKMIK
jgi:hypothetical protein